MSKTNALIIFAKNPIFGQVKTRLAMTVGAVEALEIYRQLLGVSSKLAESMSCRVMIFHGGQIDKTIYVESRFEHYLQSGKDIGRRMRNAMSVALEQSDKAVLVGTDVPELQPAIITRAFDKLQKTDVVYGPAEDGGFYLVGVQSSQRSSLQVLFENIEWSTEKVLEQSLAQCKRHNLSYELVDTLSDIDYFEDWERYLLRKV